MEAALNTSQSKHLCELGFPKWKVHEIKPSNVSLKDWIPTITIPDLLEVLPKEIENRFCINIDWNFLTETWGVEYEYVNDSFFSAGELIEALYKLCVWCIQKGYINYGQRNETTD